MIHELKTLAGFYQDIIDGLKTFEVRHNDRGFKVGDVLRLRETEAFSGKYTGRETHRRVTYIMQGGQFGIEPGFVVMALEVDSNLTRSDLAHFARKWIEGQE